MNVKSQRNVFRGSDRHREHRHCDEILKTWKNNTNTYVLDTTICTQTQIPQISPLTNNWRKRRTEHHFYTAILYILYVKY
jgi:hypothetical protein